MLGTLDEELSGRATWSRPEGGYFLWVDFAGGVDAAELLDRATEAGVTFVRGTDFFAGDGGESSARLAFCVRAARPDRRGRPHPRRARIGESPDVVAEDAAARPIRSTTTAACGSATTEGR